MKYKYVKLCSEKFNDQNIEETKAWLLHSIWTDWTSAYKSQALSYGLNHCKVAMLEYEALNHLQIEGLITEKEMLKKQKPFGKLIDKYIQPD